MITISCSAPLLCCLQENGAEGMQCFPTLDRDPGGNHRNHKNASVIHRIRSATSVVVPRALADWCLLVRL